MDQRVSLLEAGLALESTRRQHLDALRRGGASEALVVGEECPEVRAQGHGRGQMYRIEGAQIGGRHVPRLIQEGLIESDEVHRPEEPAGLADQTLIAGVTKCPSDLGSKQCR